MYVTRCIWPSYIYTYLTGYLCFDYFIEFGEFQGKYRSSSEAVCEQQDFSNHISIRNHHCYWPEERFQVIWKLNSSSVPAKGKSELARREINTSNCYPGFIVMNTAQLEISLIDLPSNMKLKKINKKMAILKSCQCTSKQGD